MSARSASQARAPVQCEGSGGQVKKQDGGTPGGKTAKQTGPPSSFPSGARRKRGGGAPQRKEGAYSAPQRKEGAQGAPQRKEGAYSAPQRKEGAQGPGNKQRTQGSRRGGGRARDGQGQATALNRDEHLESEIGSLFNPGSKKQNISHLLNFQYTPRGGGGQGREGGRRGREPRQTHPTQCYSKPKPRYSARHYLQANCQFIVRAGKDYTEHYTDPDALVDWDCVEQVILRQGGSSPTMCPICLFPPSPAKLTLCGHVYCWPCVLHYLALSDEEERKCPICDQAIRGADLRSVLVLPQPEQTTGSEVTMRLMKRERESLVAAPADCSLTTTSGLPSVAQAGPNRRFIKMFQASPQEVAGNILGREKQELQQKWAEEKDTPESCFIMEALNLLASREEEALLLGQSTTKMTHPTNHDMEKEMPQLETLSIAGANTAVDPFGSNEEEKEGEEVVTDTTDKAHELNQMENNTEPAAGMGRPRYSSGESGSSTEDMTEQDTTDVTVEDLDISRLQGHPKEKTQERRQTFYFYQASDGQPIFLHALNVQMLVTEFGSLELCPLTIKAKILEKDASSMTVDLRDRLRYLRHLPVTSAFEVAELELDCVVSPETLRVYKEQLEERRRRRNRKQREEKRREKRIQVEERRLMGRFPSPMARIESQYHYPPVRAHQQTEELEPNQQIEGGLPDEANIGFSFAHAAAARPNPAATAQQPSVPRSASSPTGWVVLGPNMKPAVQSNNTQSDSEPEIEGYQPPPQATSLGDALALALANAPQSMPGGQPHTGKKKGKRGKCVLLTGGHNRPI